MNCFDIFMNSSQVVKRLAEGSIYSDDIYDPVVSKTLLVTAIESKSKILIRKLLNQYEEWDILTSELFAVGFSRAYQRNIGDVVYDLILFAAEKEIFIDAEILHSAMHILYRMNRLNESWDLVNLINNRTFNIDDYKTCDLTMYRMVLGCAMKNHTNVNRGILRNIVMLIAAYPTAKLRQGKNTPLIREKEQLFLSALQSCVFRADFPLALDIYIMYLRSLDDMSGAIVIDMKAYSYLLLSYLRYPIPKSKTKHPILDTILSHIIKADVDKLPVISNLLLQVYSVRDDVARARAYLTRMKQMNIPITTNAWISYHEMLARLNIK